MSIRISVHFKANRGESRRAEVFSWLVEEALNVIEEPWKQVDDQSRVVKYDILVLVRPRATTQGAGTVVMT